MKKIILASASPRRKELLENLGLKFSIIPSLSEEIIEDKPFTPEMIEKIAYDKASDVAKRIDYPAIIIGSDTVVVINNKVLGKPENIEDAKKMLRLLSGKTHSVISAIAIIDTSTKKFITDFVESKVNFKEINDAQINAYINTGEPMDKAGSYAIQGIAGEFIESIEGCYNNIVGISTAKLAAMLKIMEIDVCENQFK